MPKEVKDTASEISSLIMAVSFLAAFAYYGYFFFILRGEVAKNKMGRVQLHTGDIITP